MDAFIKKGFYTIGALKTNRILYPCGIKQKVSEFALHLRKTDAAVSLVTVGSRSYYVYRYEGNLNGIENAVVLITYPKDAFQVPKALRAFISTDVSLSTKEILDKYADRWDIIPISVLCPLYRYFFNTDFFQRVNTMNKFLINYRY